MQILRKKSLFWFCRQQASFLCPREKCEVLKSLLAFIVMYNNVTSYKFQEKSDILWNKTTWFHYCSFKP